MRCRRTTIQTSLVGHWEIGGLQILLKSFCFIIICPICRASCTCKRGRQLPKVSRLLWAMRWLPAWPVPKPCKARLLPERCEPCEAVAGPSWDYSLYLPCHWTCRCWGFMSHSFSYHLFPWQEQLVPGLWSWGIQTDSAYADGKPWAGSTCLHNSLCFSLH